MDRIRQLGAMLSLPAEQGAALSIAGMALLCLLQQLAQLRRMKQIQAESESLRVRAAELEAELGRIAREQSLAELELQAFRELVAQADTDRAIDLLLRQYADNTTRDFAAFVRITGNSVIIDRSRGLSQVSRRSFCIDRHWLHRLREGTPIVFDQSPSQSELLQALAPEDRAKARSLYLVAAGKDQPHILVTTALYPAGASRDEQLSLGTRLLTGIVGRLGRSQDYAAKEQQLRCATDILELRSIGDRRYDEPHRMVQDFLDVLRRKLSADSAALYLIGPDSGGRHQSAIRCAADISRIVLPHWQRHEDRLAELNLGRKHIRTLRRQELQRIGIETLMSAALVVPLARRDDLRPIGLACFAWRQEEPPADAQLELIRWAASYLPDNLLRVLNFAVIERQAREDGLTELANRRTFDQQISRSLGEAARSRDNCGLLLIDLDRFKQVNDVYGHQAGDEVLRATAQRLRESCARLGVDNRALIARYGGEGVAILLPDIRLAGAQRIAEALRTAVAAKPIDFPPHKIPVTISVGLAAFPEHGRTPTDLMAAADAALYRAKRGGRNRICCASEMAAAGG